MNAPMTTATHPELAAAAEQIGLPLTDLHVLNRPDLRNLHAELLVTARGLPLAGQNRILNAAHYLVKADDIWKTLPNTVATSPGGRDRSTRWCRNAARYRAGYRREVGGRPRRSGLR